jgi:hypothetical protein
VRRVIGEWGYKEGNGYENSKKEKNEEAKKEVSEHQGRFDTRAQKIRKFSLRTNKSFLLHNHVESHTAAATTASRGTCFLFATRAPHAWHPATSQLSRRVGQ